VVEAVGPSATIRLAYDLTRRGGQTIVVGAGRLDLEGMITARRPLEEVNEAFDAMNAGEVVRQILTP